MNDGRIAIRRLVLASNNEGKLREFQRLLAPLGVEVIAQAELRIPETDEPHATFVENALAKARHASAHAKLPALADDSGLCVRALDGAPGVQSARYAGEPRSDARNNAKLIEALRGVADRRAHYACVLALVRRADDPEPIIAEGSGTARSSMSRAAPAASATTPTSSTHPPAGQAPSCRSTGRTSSRIVARRSAR